MVKSTDEITVIWTKWPNSEDFYIVISLLILSLPSDQKPEGLDSLLKAKSLGLRTWWKTYVKSIIFFASFLEYF